MTIATQLMGHYKISTTELIPATYDYNGLADEAEERALEVTQDFDNESTEYDFADSSVLIVCGLEINAYGMR